MTMRLRRAALLMTGSLLLAACGASAEEDAATEVGAAAPVVVPHAYGETEVAPAPERVVTLDLQWTDTMLGVGIEPVGVAVDSLMPGGEVPWQERPADSVALDLTDGLPFEEIADLEPDLIVGSFSVPDAESYETLSQIAPTVATLGEGQVDRWTDMVDVAGEVLGREDEAVDLVDEVQADVATAAADLPGLQGRSFVLARYSPGDGFLAVGDPEDGSSLLFRDLGMELYSPVQREAERTGDARVAISPELTDMLAADLVVLSLFGAEESDMQDVPGFADLPGEIVYLDYASVVGLNTPTPASVPYVLEQLVPALERVAGD